jgi:signal peptidase I
LLLLIAVSTAKGRDNPDLWVRGIYVGCSPRPVFADEPQAWQLASTCAEGTPESFVLIGSGRSMQPLYNPGTILVLRHLPYGELQRGQTVLYRNQANKVVAHVLVTKARDGWRTQGLGNASHDMEPVRGDNLVGVVIAAFSPLPGVNTIQLAAAR